MPKKPTYEELEQRVNELVQAESEHKRIEKALRESEEKYRTILETIEDGYYEIDLGGNFTFFNDSMCKISGYSRDELMGMNNRQYTDEVYAKKIYQTFNKVYTTGKPDKSFHWPVIRKDSTKRTVATSVSLRRDTDGEPVGFRGIVRDITESKQAEEALRKSESSLSRAQTIAHLGNWEYDSLTGKITWSGEAYRIFGFAPQELDVTTDLIQSMIHPEDRNRVETALQDVQGVFGQQDLEYRIIRRDGTVRHIHSQRDVSVAEEVPVRIFGTLQDITARKQAEETLRESEEKYRSLFEESRDAIVLTTQQGKIIDANPAALELFGYIKEEILKMNFQKLYVEPDEGYRFQKEMKEKDSAQDFETKLCRKDGAEMDCIFDVVCRQSDDGKILKYQGIIRDISEAKRVQEALWESKDNLDKAQEIAHVGSWRRDLKKDQGYWSDEMYRILGLTPGDPEAPSRKDFLSRIHPADRERIASVLKEAVEKKKPFDFEFRTVPIEGSERIVHSQGEVVCDETETPVVLQGTNRDMTERRRLQDQLQETQKMEAIATLAGGVAHEFNNTLMGIMGNIELLKMNFSEDEGIDKHLESMKSAGHRMSRLTDQLLAYAEGGKYQPKDLKLDDFVIETLSILQHDLSPEVRVETHFSKDISVIKADNAQMQMVLSAILANSNEAIEEEGLIRITAGNKDLDEDSLKQHPGLKPGPYVCLAIEDDGKGMDEETRKGIFEPFFTTKFQGRGMGMAAVYGIVKNHDGWIYVDSELGKGTTVQIYLPVSEITVEEPKKAEVEVVRGSGTILMIEDEDVVIEVTQAMLEWLGYRVMVAKTGKDAIHITKTFDGQIDLALLDIKLPDMEGGKVYPHIMEARPDLKVIVFSGFAIEGPARKILDAGAQDFIQKPFSLATLSEKLKEVLEGKQPTKLA